MPPKNKGKKGKKADDDDYWSSSPSSRFHTTSNQSIGKRLDHPSPTTISPLLPQMVMMAPPIQRNPLHLLPLWVSWTAHPTRRTRTLEA